MNPPSSDPARKRPEDAVSDLTQPIIVDMGKRKARMIRDLKEGEGELWEEVLDVLDETREMLGKDAEGKVLLPIILLYEKRPRRLRLERLMFPLAEWDDDTEDDDEDE